MIGFIPYGCLVALLGAPEPPSLTCTCSKAKIQHSWCEACKVGFVAGVRIESELLHQEIDSHGHVIDPERIQCPSCQKALATDGFCERCRRGFVGKKAYLSRLTYLIAKGVTKEVEKITCRKCLEHSTRHGWCDGCNVGMVGNVAFASRTEFDQACKAYDVLCEAVRTSKRCLTCAVVMMLDGQCPTCKITYKNGIRQ